jgi:hypothetical protein
MNYTLPDFHKVQIHYRYAIQGFVIVNYNYRHERWDGHHCHSGYLHYGGIAQPSRKCAFASISSSDSKFPPASPVCKFGMAKLDPFHLPGLDISFGWRVWGKGSQPILSSSKSSQST